MKKGTPRGTHHCTLKRETSILAKVCKQYTFLAGDVARMLIRGGGGLFIYSCPARRISFEFKLISKEISWA